MVAKLAVRRMNKVWVTTKWLVAGVLIAGCQDSVQNGASAPGPAGPGGGKPTVVCTTTMITDLVKNLAGDLVTVKGIMRAGEDPHVYDVRPHDAELLAEADLVLTNGFHLEATLDHIIENNASGVVVALAEKAVAAPLGSQTTGGAPDPHCWMNVNYFRGYAEHARDALIQIDPTHAEQYRQQADKYLAQLDELHDWIVRQMASVPRDRRVMVTSHDAFEYLGAEYGIDVHGMIGISTEQAPRPQDIEKLESLIRDRGVRALFVETSVSQTLNNLVRKSATATGARIGGTLFSDSLGEPDSAGGTYIDMMRHNISTIVEALK
jgi:manganese/zinc/iron transport system substrate-binding protein